MKSLHLPTSPWSQIHCCGDVGVLTAFLPCLFLSTLPNFRHGNAEFHQCQVFITVSFEAETIRLLWGHEESSVYVAAMLKSQTVWFMAVERDRDQRSVSCWVCSLFPLAPLPSLPGTQHRHRPPGLSRRIRGILSTHLLTALQVLTPMGCKECRRRWGCEHLAQQWGSARVAKRQPWAEDQGNLAEGKRRASGMAHCWESESSWMELLSFSQHNKD